ncbi:MAG: bifunctional demethylmenaquinone methyltransferase/2-methoxy-6-polyprenyl-1,4-benzoquinol methylase UbiE [Bergeyella sp.]|nr:bifunctional demethylmenaquinone methyltransferase/2-methoxy-6-polyprenyl-1,4-benzoquinol methylase UbiE [Bergeyella sp.]
MLNSVTPYQNQEKNKKEQVEAMFDNIASNYDFLNRILSLKMDVLWRRELVEWLTGESPKKVLDVATGTGDLAIEIQKHTRAQVVGLDLSQKMLEAGQEKLNKKGLNNKIFLTKGDAEHMSFDDESFDAVTVAFGARNFQNLEQGLKEMNRVVKKGGSVYILEFSKVEGFLGPLYAFYFKKILPKMGKIISGDQRAYTYLPDSVEVFPYGKQMEDKLSNMGYQNVKSKKLTFGIATIYKAVK